MNKAFQKLGLHPENVTVCIGVTILTKRTQCDWTDLDRVEIYENILKLSHEEEGRRHALSTWNGVCKEEKKENVGAHSQLLSHS